MGKPTNVGTIVVGSDTTWVPKDLMFWIVSAPVTGPLARYRFKLCVLSRDGKTVYEDWLDKPDEHSLIFAPRKYLDPRGGFLSIGGLYTDMMDFGSLKSGSINPLINGLCSYKTNMSGKRLMFKVFPLTVQSGSDTRSVGDAKAVSDPTVSGTGSYTVAPGGMGGAASFGVTQPGDVKTHSDTLARARNATSVTGLDVTQIPVAD